MPLAAIQAIGDMLVSLPMRPQTFLKIIGFVELRNILKLVDANHDFQTLILGDFFSEIEDLIGIPFDLFPVERSFPITNLGTIREKNFFVFPTASSQREEVASMTVCASKA